MKIFWLIEKLVEILQLLILLVMVSKSENEKKISCAEIRST